MKKLTFSLINFCICPQKATFLYFKRLLTLRKNTWWMNSLLCIHSSRWIYHFWIICICLLAVTWDLFKVGIIWWEESWKTLTWIWKDLQNGFGKRKSDSWACIRFQSLQKIYCINNWNIGYFNVHVQPITNENVFYLFLRHIHIMKKSHVLPDTKPDFREPQFAFTRQELTTENSKYFPVTCRKWILKEMFVALREWLHIVIQISVSL